MFQFLRWKNWNDAKFGKMWIEWFFFEWSNLFIYRFDFINEIKGSDFIFGVIFYG